MSGFREPGFSDRQKAAQEARKNLLNKFKSQPGPDDPAVVAKRAEREALAAKRAEAKAARETEKAEQKRRYNAPPSKGWILFGWHPSQPGEWFERWFATSEKAEQFAARRQWK